MNDLRSDPRYAAALDEVRKANARWSRAQAMGGAGRGSQEYKAAFAAWRAAQRELEAARKDVSR